MTTTRTNVVIDDDLIEEAMALTGIQTKREVIDTALRNLVRLKRQRAILALKGTVEWEGDLDAWREARTLGEIESGDSVNSY